MILTAFFPKERPKYRIMKKYLIFLLLIGLKLTVSAQTISYSHTKLEKVDTSCIVLEYQRESIILGQNYPTIIVTDIVYNREVKGYFVSGFVDNVNYYPDQFKHEIYEIRIMKKKSDHYVYTATTTRNGVFAFSLRKGEKARFIVELDVDLYIKNECN